MGIMINSKHGSFSIVEVTKQWEKTKEPKQSSCINIHKIDKRL